MRIGIMYAMLEERKAFTSMLSDYQKVTFAGLQAYECRLNTHELTLVECGVGKVHAAVATTKLLQARAVDLLINTGVSGGLNIQPETLVLSRAVSHHDVDARAFGRYVKGQVPGLPPFFLADAHALAVAQTCAAQLGIESRVGMLVSGDQFLTASDALNDMVDLYDDVLATDMEAAAVGQVAFLEHVPFLMIRSISDQLDTPTQIQDFETFLTAASKRAAELVYAMVQKL